MSDDMVAAAFWAQIDAVLVINLDHRTDRWARFQSEVAGYLPPAKVNRVPAVLGRELPGFGERPWFRGRSRDATWGARGGCVLSHQRALQQAQDAGWGTVLILEDDVAFTPACSEVLANWASSANPHAQAWDICYLGYTDPQWPFRPLASLADGHQLHRVFGASTTHAYLVRAEARDWILRRLPATATTLWPWLARARAIDRWYYRNLGRAWRVAALSPAVAVQADSFSDIVGRPTDYFSNPLHAWFVPESKLSTTDWQRQRHYRQACFQLADAIDTIRSWDKRWRGF